VGSNPAGRATQFKGLQRCRPFYYEPVASTQDAVAAEIAHDMARIAKTTGIQMSE
jgi:hypothetical protein